MKPDGCPTFGPATIEVLTERATRTLVFAGNAWEARGWADAHGVRPKDYVYVSSSKVLRGQWPGNARVFVGTVHERRDLSELLQHLAIIDSTL